MIRDGDEFHVRWDSHNHTKLINLLSDWSGCTKTRRTSVTKLMTCHISFIKWKVKVIANITPAASIIYLYYTRVPSLSVRMLIVPYKSQCSITSLYRAKFTMKFEYVKIDKVLPALALKNDDKTSAKWKIGSRYILKIAVNRSSRQDCCTVCKLKDQLSLCLSPFWQSPRKPSDCCRMYWNHTNSTIMYSCSLVETVPKYRKVCEMEKLWCFFLKDFYIQRAQKHQHLMQALQTKKKKQTIDLEAVSNPKSSEEFRIAGSFPTPCCKIYKHIFPF